MNDVLVKALETAEVTFSKGFTHGYYARLAGDAEACGYGSTPEDALDHLASKLVA